MMAASPRRTNTHDPGSGIGKVPRIEIADPEVPVRSNGSPRLA
jgi:hypothetical protein